MLNIDTVKTEDQIAKLVAKANLQTLKWGMDRVQSFLADLQPDVEEEGFEAIGEMLENLEAAALDPKAEGRFVQDVLAYLGGDEDLVLPFYAKHDVVIDVLAGEAHHKAEWRPTTGLRGLAMDLLVPAWEWGLGSVHACLRYEVERRAQV